MARKKARKPLTKPRKIASQERSRATVDALVEATARILVREGFDKASTNRIAEVAGVSVGSLYQYFPGKEALVAAVIERHRTGIMRIVEGELAKAASEPLEKGIRLLVAAAIRAHQLDPRLHRVLAEEIPKVGNLEKAQTFNPENVTMFRAYLERHRDEISVADPGLAAFLCVNAIEAVTHNAVLQEKIVSDEAMNRLMEETSRLVLGYLRA